MHSQARAKKNTHKQLPKLVYRWHRRIGTSAALFVIWIVISGWLLNHSDSLGLAQVEFHNAWLAKWYGLPVQSPETMFATGTHTLITNDDNVIFDGHSLGLQKMHPIGMAQSQKFVAIASENFLLLLDHEGHMVDSLNSNDLPSPHIDKIGVGCGGIALDNKGEIVASSDGIEWQPCRDTIEWSAAQAMPAEQFKRFQNLLAPNISLEKLVVDLHTGRFFGRYGPWVIDIVGGCLLLLALSGLWLYARLNNTSHRDKKPREQSLY